MGKMGFVNFLNADTISLGTSRGKTNVYLTGTITTTATTADQVILTRTVTTGKTFFLQYIMISARLTTLSATASILGTASIETPSATKIMTETFTNDTTSSKPIHTFKIEFDEPIPIGSGVVIRAVCTPSAVTSMIWRANFGGYEK